MIYNYCKEISNVEDNVDGFFNKNKFVGYILPNGLIYKTKNHNVSNAETFFMNSLFILKDNFSDKEKILGETDDLLCQIISRFFQNLSYDKIMALNDFISKNSLSFSDILVSLFGCHLVTRLDKTIITALGDHRPFYNYLLDGFRIETIDKIIYDEEKKQYVFRKNYDQNRELYEEIEEIRNEIINEEAPLFRKKLGKYLQIILFML